MPRKPTKAEKALIEGTETPEVDQHPAASNPLGGELILEETEVDVSKIKDFITEVDDIDYVDISKDSTKPEHDTGVERPEIIRDPFEGHQATEILKHPEKVKLQWCNPEFRARYGMRGWKPVHYDDPIGRNLSDYVAEIPLRMAGMASIDNTVRMGDLMLCWIEDWIYEARQLSRTEKANRHLKSGKTNVAYSGGGGYTEGDGVGLDPEAARAQSVSAAKGMVDARTKAPGRGMMD